MIRGRHGRLSGASKGNATGQATEGARAIAAGLPLRGGVPPAPPLAAGSPQAQACASVHHMRLHLVGVAVVLGVVQRRKLQAVPSLAHVGGAHDGGDGEGAVAPVASLSAAWLLVACEG